MCVCDDISKAIIASMNQNNHKEIDNERTSDFIYTEVHKPEGTSFLFLRNGCNDKNNYFCRDQLVIVIFDARLVNSSPGVD